MGERIVVLLWGKFMALPSLLRDTITFIVSSVVLWNLYFSGSFDTIPTMQVLNIIFYVAALFAFVYSGINLLHHGASLLCHGVKLVSMWVLMWWKKRKAKKEREAIEAEARVRDDELKELLLSLSPSMASLLLFIYMRRPIRGVRSAYIPCDNSDAKELYIRGLITSNLAPVLRGGLFIPACECYEYRLSDNVASFLARRRYELGAMWGCEEDIPALGKYQRAGKPLILESGM